MRLHPNFIWGQDIRVGDHANFGWPYHWQDVVELVDGVPSDWPLLEPRQTRTAVLSNGRKQLVRPTTLYRIIPRPDRPGSRGRYWTEGEHLHCDHGIILYGTTCRTCEKEPEHGIR